MENMDLLVKYIKESKNTVFFGGAGVSTLSGLKDFRSVDGLYNENYKYPPESILSHTFFMNNTLEFYKFYKDKLNSLKYKPNIVHYTLKAMEDKKLLQTIITQNIDGFHQMTGSKIVYELHGSIMNNHCIKCHKKYDANYVFNSNDIPTCSCGGIIKPDVVLYEETLDDNTVGAAIKAISNCDLLIVGGTSLTVYPAASFINYFRGKNIVLINRDVTPYDKIASLVIHDDLGKVFKYIKEKII